MSRDVLLLLENCRELALATEIATATAMSRGQRFRAHSDLFFYQRF